MMYSVNVWERICMSGVEKQVQHIDGEDTQCKREDVDIIYML